MLKGMREGALWRRWTPPVAALLVSLIAGGCTSASVALHVHSAPAVSPPSSRLPGCVAATLTAVGGRQSENMGAHGDIEFSNAGRVPCVLAPVSRVSPSFMPTGHHWPCARHPLLIRQWAQLSCDRASAMPLCSPCTGVTGVARAPGPLRIRIQLPGSSGVLTAPFDGPPDYDYVPVCLSSGLPSTIAVISAYSQDHPGDAGLGQGLAGTRTRSGDSMLSCRRSYLRDRGR